MQPLRLEWRLQSPVCGLARPLHLDALVARAVTEQALANGFTGRMEEPGETLPIEKAEQGGLWCWKASALMAQDVHGRSMRLWTRRTPVEDLAERIAAGEFSDIKPPTKPFTTAINTNSGLWKNHYQFHSVRHVDRYVAYCIGDLDLLSELLDPEIGYIRFIGARGRSGFGAIREDGFSIDTDDAALEMWKKRALPWPEDGYFPDQLATRPPYWAIENRDTAYLHPSLYD